MEYRYEVSAAFVRRKCDDGVSEIVNVAPADSLDLSQPAKVDMFVFWQDAEWKIHAVAEDASTVQLVRDA